MLHRQEDTPTTTHDAVACTRCTRDFIVPVSIVGLLEEDRCLVELACTNCETTALAVHDDRSLHELDRRLDETTAAMHAAVELISLADDLDRIDRFAEALHAGHILPEDF
jgi:hypothetical protein